jgi:hypothetical protein
MVDAMMVSTDANSISVATAAMTRNPLRNNAGDEDMI